MASINSGVKAEEAIWITEFADKIADICYNKYESLPRKGKPSSEREWTLMACVLKVEGFKKFKNCVNDISVEVIALGTGSKCIGKSKMSRAGDILNDCHAEVMARRGFLRYLYHQIHKTYQSGSSEVFCAFSNGKCIFKENVTFHFFSSHTPCGDASIIPKFLISEEDVGLSVKANKTDRGTAVIPEVISNDDGLPLENDENSLTEYTCYRDASVSIKNNPSEHDSGLSLKVVKNEHDITLNMKDTNKTQSIQNNSCFKTIAEETINTENAKRKLSSNGDFLEGIDSKKKKIDYGMQEIKSDSVKINCLEESDVNSVYSDIYRTGAKCLPSESVQDEHLPGNKYHVTGVLRTKPGRGDPTLSFSCSDKLARWNAVGVQGALVSLLINKPVYFQSVIIGGGCPFSETVMQRAISQRLFLNMSANQCNNDIITHLHLPEYYSIAAPIIVQSTLPFVHRRNSDDKKPCPSSLVWCNVPESMLQVAVEGKKQGVTKKLAHTSAGRLLICKKELLCQFEHVALSMPQYTLNLPIILKTEQITSDMEEAGIKHYLTHTSYKQLKYLSRDYKSAWETVRSNCFPSWVRKCDSFLDFISFE